MLVGLKGFGTIYGTPRTLQYNYDKKLFGEVGYYAEFG